MCSKACLYSVSRANIRRTDCVGPILSHIERPKSNIHENQVIATPSLYFSTLPHKSTSLHAVFERYLLDPENCTRVYVPLPSLLRMFFCFMFFSLEMWDPLRPKYPPKIKKKTSDGKKTFVKDSAGVQQKRG